MKKLFIVLLSLVCISCKIENPAETRNWDKDNIAFVNNSNFVPENYTNGTTYTRTGFIRKSGNKGIIGKFQRSISDSSNLNKPYTEVESFDFSNKGKVERYYFVSNRQTVKATDNFNLYRYSDSIFIVEIVGYNTYFYQVSGDGLKLLTTYTDENGIEHYPYAEMQNIKNR